MSTDFSDRDRRWMRRALQLARAGRGRVEPNPMVGCVLVAPSGQVLAEGFHRRFGGPHAERDALAQCPGLPPGATAYITLEPCCHTNKKTPPCVPALVEARIARAVIACNDPNPCVAGGGADQLRDARVVVQTGLLEGPAKQLNAPFFARMLHRRPYVTLKWAQSADGKVAGPAGRRTQISGPDSMRLVHALRARVDAILVGIGTVLADDPLLTPRGSHEARPILRIVLDSDLRLPLDSQLVRTAAHTPVIACCGEPAARSSRADALRAAGVQLLPLPLDAGLISLPALLAELHARIVTHLLVEPGPTLARAFLDQNLADRIWRFEAPRPINAPDAPAAPVVPWDPAALLRPGDDRLAELLNPSSAVFFDRSPSADIHLAAADLGQTIHESST